MAERRAPRWRNWTRRGLAAALVLVGAAATVLVFGNILLNFTLPAVINRNPERLRIDYAIAWMVVPGRLEVRGLRIRNQGATDQWQVSAERASGTVSVPELFERRFRAEDVRARGVSFRYQRRLDAVTTGLTATPLARRWLVALDDIEAEDVHEIWIGDYRLVGDASAVGDVSLGGPYVDVDGVLEVGNMRADLGDAPVAESIVGDIHVRLDGLDRDNLGTDRLHAVNATTRIDADVQDLRFLDFYLATIPWLSLAGVGHVTADVQLDDGQFRNGSTLSADFPELLVRFLRVDVVGAAQLRTEVVTGPDGRPQSRLVADYDDFAITHDGTSRALVEGLGFHLEATSPDVDIDQPFTDVTAVLDLPESRIPDFTMYNVFLPEDVGLAVRSGTGTVRGHLVASSVTDHASGDLYIEGTDLIVEFAPFAVTGDLAIHGRLADTWLGTGRYDVSGSKVALHHAGLIDESHADKDDGQRRWSASIAVPSGAVAAGAPIYLDARLRMKCSDSAPFVAVFSQRKTLPGWAQSLFSVSDVSGEARLQLGQRTVEISPGVIRGGMYEVELRFLRDGPASLGDLFATAGPLSLGVTLRPGGPEFQIGSRRRFDAAVARPFSHGELQ